MSIEIKIPSVGESVREAVLAEWFKQDGDTVRKDDPLFVIETDKVTLEVVAEAAGVLKILVAAGETVAIGTVVGALEPVDAAAPAPATPKAETAQAPEPEKAPVPAPAAPAAKAPAPAAPATPADSIPLAPSVRRLIAEKRLDASKIKGTAPGGRISKGDVLLYLENAPADSLFERTRQVQFVGIEYQAGIRGPPQDGFVLQIPGENAKPVGEQEPLRAQVAAYCQETFLGRQAGRGKLDLFRK